MKRLLAIAPVVALVLSMSCQHVMPTEPRPLQLEASALPDVDAIGFAAPFAGESNGALIVAGGTNFPGDPPWKKGTKVWHDDILAYDGSAWKKVGTLSPAIAGGASVSTKHGVICIGGGDAKTVVADVFLLKYENGAIVREELSPLPKPTQACATVQVGDRIYAVGGHNQLAPLVPGPSASVYSIDVNALKSGWREETPIPAEPRWFPVVGTDGKNLFVISGFTGVKDGEGKAQIHCLSDVWRYEPANDRKWTRLADLPRANAASPSPAPYANGKLLLMGGGVEDATLKIPMQEQKGFPMTITAVDAKTGEAQIIGDVRSSVVVGPVVPWKGGWIVVSGEIRSGVRTPSVWWYRAK
jgi:N-acetylneuraminic acid mutarotase